MKYNEKTERLEFTKDDMGQVLVLKKGKKKINMKVTFSDKVFGVQFFADDAIAASEEVLTVSTKKNAKPIKTKYLGVWKENK